MIIQDLQEKHFDMLTYIARKELDLTDFRKSILRPYLEHKPQNEYFNVATNSGIPIGFIYGSLKDNQASIDYLAIEQDNQKQGIGTKLILHTANQLKEKNIESISVNSLTKAEMFYASFFDYQGKRLYTAQTNFLITRIETYEQEKYQLEQIHKATSHL